MGRGELVSQTLPPLEDLRLEWRPPEQLSFIAHVPRQPLGSEPPTHLDIHLSFNFLETSGHTSESNRLLLRMGTRAAEGGGGRMRANAEVPHGLYQSLGGGGSGLCRVLVRGRLLWQKGAKGDFEHGPQLEAHIVIPCVEVSNGVVPPVVRAGCLEVIEKAAREAESIEQAHYQQLLRQLLMAWRYKSGGDEATWLNYCGLPEEQAQALLKEWLVDPLECYVHKLRAFLSVDESDCMPVGLWEAWDSGHKTLDAWKVFTMQGPALPPANGNVGAALEALQQELEQLVAAAWQVIEKPVLDPLRRLVEQAAQQDPDMETLWTERGVSRTVLGKWSVFRGRVALMHDTGGEEADVGQRLNQAMNELRRSVVVAEDVLVKDLEAKVQDLHRILERIEAVAAKPDRTPKVYATEIQTAIANSQTLLRVWSHQEEHAPAFWQGLTKLGALQLREAQNELQPQDAWALWRCGFETVVAREQLGQQAHTENKTFKALVDDLISCMSELLLAALQCLSRTFVYPLVIVEEEVGVDFGKVHIGGYEALQLCIKNQPRTAAMAREPGAVGKLGSFLVDMAGQLQEQVLTDIHSTAKNLEMATAEETKEVAELIEALKTLDFDLTRWNFMRPCIAKMSTCPGAVGEMMKKLLFLADKVRATRDAKDLLHIKSFVSHSSVSRTSSQLSAWAGSIDFGADATAEMQSRHTELLQPSTEITVGPQYHQVKSTGCAIGLVTRLKESIDPGAEISRLEVAPLVPVEAVPRGWSQAFLDTVENYNPQHQDSADDVVKRHYGWLPTDVKARKIALLAMYTTNTLYCDVSKALYDNDRQLLCENAGFIGELRDVFLVGQTSPIVAPFIGDAVRSMKLDPQKLEAFSQVYEAGQAVCWPSFTSTSDGAEREDGNVLFRICCGRMGPPPPGQHFPSLVKAFSAFPERNEVIFPPHSMLRVINISHDGGDAVTVELETMESFDVWETIRKQDWASFDAWACRHPEFIETRTRKQSMIGVIAESITTPLDKTGSVPNPFDTCMKFGADANEMHKKETPYTIIEKKFARSTGQERQMYEDWLACLRQHGAVATRSPP